MAGVMTEQKFSIIPAIFSYTSFYNVDKDGKLKELNTTFSEYESQPDLMDQVSDESDVMVYSNIINGKGYYNYIVYDLMKESPSSYVYRVSSLAIVDDVVTETNWQSNTKHMMVRIMQRQSAIRTIPGQN